MCRPLYVVTQMIVTTDVRLCNVYFQKANAANRSRATSPAPTGQVSSLPGVADSCSSGHCKASTCLTSRARADHGLARSWRQPTFGGTRSGNAPPGNFGVLGGGATHGATLAEVYRVLPPWPRPRPSRPWSWVGRLALSPRLTELRARPGGHIGTSS
jgi:hypothetical protein